MNDINILLHLLMIHLVVGLIFASFNLTKHVKDKKIKSGLLYISSAIYALSIYLVSSSWIDLWIIPVAFIANVFAYLLMIPKRRNLIYFLTGQLLLIFLLISIWLFITENELSLLISVIVILLNSKKVLLLILGFIILIWPSGYIIGIATEPLRKQIKEAKGLEKAGMWIGILERTLIYIFVLSGNVMAIAFLVTAKTIFRFGEIKEHSRRKEAEYILIGTLLSFSVALLISYLIKFFL